MCMWCMLGAAKVCVVGVIAIRVHYERKERENISKPCRHNKWQHSPEHSEESDGLVVDSIFDNCDM
jgi:hypothetical protein